jgi:hypothetical protein
MALASFMRLSLRKAAHAFLSKAALQEIRVRSGRDDKGEGDASMESGCCTEAIFIPLGGPQAIQHSGRQWRDLQFLFSPADASSALGQCEGDVDSARRLPARLPSAGCNHDILFPVHHVGRGCCQTGEG